MLSRHISFNLIRNISGTNKIKSLKEHNLIHDNVEPTSSEQIGSPHFVIKSTNTLNNIITSLQLSMKPRMRRHKNFRQTELPKNAIIGLKRAIIDLKRTPKELQTAADILTEKLSQRHYGPSVDDIHKAKKEIADKLREDTYDLDPSTGILGEKIKKGWRKELKYLVAQRLKRSQRKWKPITVNACEDAATLALSQLGNYYAEVKLVLEEFERIRYKPKAILDYGSGIGSVFWACYSNWGETVDEYCMVEPNDILSGFAMDIMRGDKEGSKGLISNRIYFRRSLPSTPQKIYDIVFLHRTLIEIQDEKERMAILETLWQRTNKYMVIIESNMRDSFESLMASRDFILTKGYTIDTNKVIQLFEEHNLMSDEVDNIISNQEISVNEKYYQLKSMLPLDINIPTMLESGHVFAPCPHDIGCPLLSGCEKKSCKFNVAVNEIRADGKSKCDGTIRHQFSYVILEKGIRPITKSFSRILEKVQAKNSVGFTNCTPFDGIQYFMVPKKAGNIYKAIKYSRAGELFPINDEFMESNSEFSFIQNMLRQSKRDS